MSLLSACEKADLALVQQCLKVSDIEERDFYGNTSLAICVRSGHIAIATYLVSLGANVNSTNHVFSNLDQSNPFTHFLILREY